GGGIRGLLEPRFRPALEPPFGGRAAGVSPPPATQHPDKALHTFTQQSWQYSPLPEDCAQSRFIPTKQDHPQLYMQALKSEASHALASDINDGESVSRTSSAKANAPITEKVATFFNTSLNMVVFLFSLEARWS